jgi:hypothetical protein
VKRWAVISALLVALAGAGVWLYFVAGGPRMRVQVNIRPFEAAMPLPPPDSVPLTAPAPLPDAEQARAMVNPLAPTTANIAQGAVYYEYYCRFCHGAHGRAETQVSDSYMPKPADLGADRVARMSDGELVRAMLLGIGHEPVLERVIPGKCYWYLALFVRTLPESEGKQ